MNQGKPFYKSTGVMGGMAAVVSALVSLIAALSALKGIEISGESQALIVTIVCTLAGAVAGLIGRIKADSRIGKAMASGGVYKGPGLRIVGEPSPEVLPDKRWDRGRGYSAVTYGSGVPPVSSSKQDKLAESLSRLSGVLENLAPAKPAVEPLAEGQLVGQEAPAAPATPGQGGFIGQGLLAFILALALGTLLLLGCAPGQNGSLTADQTAQLRAEAVQYGITWMDGSLESFKGAVAATRAESPAKASAIDEKLMPWLSAFSDAVTAYKASPGNGQWDTALKMLNAVGTVALDVGVPIAARAIIGAI